MEARQQSELIRRSIEDRTRYDANFDAVDGDHATYLARDATHALRDHVTNAQTLLEAISEQLPDVHFTIEELDAVSMIAATIREQRLDESWKACGWPGCLNEVPSRRRAGSGAEGAG
jgi:hypothetical protein